MARASTAQPVFGPTNRQSRTPRDTTFNMVSRFRRDVVRLRPRVVVIAGGLNDLNRTIAALNAWIRASAAQNHYTLVDYYAVLSDRCSTTKKD